MLLIMFRSLKCQVLRLPSRLVRFQALHREICSINNTTEKEIERKFKPSALSQDIVKEKAITCKTKSFIDVYYDDSKFTLTTHDYWLRKRDQIYELKSPSKVNDNKEDDVIGGIDFYDEDRDWNSVTTIIHKLRGEQVTSSTTNSSCEETWLLKHGFKAFVSIKTDRSRYYLEVPSSKNNEELHSCYVDIDEVEYLGKEVVDNLSNKYRIGEVELCSTARNSTADQAIADIMSHLSISSDTVKGKLLEYLARFSPKHYLALENAGLLQEKLGNVQSKLEDQVMANALFRNNAVNFHFTRKCNFQCKFCFHTSKSSHVLPIGDCVLLLKQVREAGARKINFAGGEPFLPSYQQLLGEMVKYCKEIGFESVSIITNNSHVKRDWFEKYGKYLDILGVSCDTAHVHSNLKHGRYRAGSKIINFEENLALKQLISTADICREFGVMFKLNTVVTAINHEETLFEVVNEVRPMRWKIFQVLAIEGENTGNTSNKKQDVAPLTISKSQFEAYLERNMAGVFDRSIVKAESNEVMRSSYVLIDEYGRLLDTSMGMKLPTESIMKVGIEEASRQLLSSCGGGFDRDMFLHRGGYYPEAWSKPAVDEAN